jgi:phosphoglycerate dehydrogenase-like enzyme
VERFSIWTNVLLKDRAEALLVEGTSGHNLIRSKPGDHILAAGGRDSDLLKVQIAFGQPDPNDLITAPLLGWVQLSSAGYTRYERADLRQRFEKDRVALTNSSAVFSAPCAQHALAWLLAHSRQLLPAYDNQTAARGWPQNELRDQCRLLGGQTILLIGFGSIGAELATYLAPLHAKVIGYRRNPVEGGPIPMIGPAGLNEALCAADHVVNILPGSPETDGFFSADRFALMKRGACYYNLGRGTTTDQEALRAALVEGRIAAAYLDVAEPEPLPSSDPLWTTPNCFITPHSSGGHANEWERLVLHFVANLRRFEQGEPLVNRVF